MIRKLSQACEKLNKKLGVSVTLPNPGEKALKRTAAFHLAVGAGMMAAGAVFRSKWCAVLGGVGLLNSMALRKECERKTDD